MTEKKLNLYTNLFFFFIFIPVLTLVVPTVKWVETRPWLFVAVTVYLIIIYQALTHANIPGLFIRRHYLRSIIYMLLSLGITALFARFAVWLSYYERPATPQHWSPIESTVWFLFLVILGFSFFYNMLMESTRLARAREEMEAQRDKAKTIAVTMLAPTNAATTMDSWKPKAVALPPKSNVTKATARLAPLVIPKMEGPAKGLRKAVCKSNPATESDAPQSIATMA